MYSTSGSEGEEVQQRGSVSEWCHCHECIDMPTHREKLCCHDVQKCADKLIDSVNRYKKDEPFICITEHPGFTLNCLQPEVLDNAWLSYKQHYGANAYVEQGDVYKRYRHVAYR